MNYHVTETKTPSDFHSASRGDGFVAEFKMPDRTNGADKDPAISEFRSDFKKAFTEVTEDGVRGTGSGHLLKYSYYDTRPETWGVQFSVTRPSWDNLVNLGSNYARFPSEEVKALNMAIREGMLDNIPPSVHYISLGPGEETAFREKDCLILSGLTASNHAILGATVVDIHNRYAVEAASAIYDRYQTDAIAFKKDIFTQGIADISVKSGATPLVAVFGGTLQNIPLGANTTSDKELVKFYKALHQGIPNAHLVMTVDTTPEDVDPALAVSAYEYSLEIELFVLNFMARAKEQGIIKNENYDILKHWKMANPEWKDKSSNISILAKRDHVLQTVDGDYQIKAGDIVSVSRSRKGPIEDHRAMLQEGGFKTVDYYPQNALRARSNPAKYIIHAAP